MRVLLLSLLLLPPVLGDLIPKGTLHPVVLTIDQPGSNKDRQSGIKGTAPMTVWLPEGDAPLRGLVMNPFYEPASKQQHWQAAARHWRFGMIGADFSNVQARELGATTLRGLNALAEKTGRPELNTIKICLVGMSAGGGMSTRIAEQIPERVLAVAPVCLEVGPRNEASRKIPMMTIFGEKDGRQMKQLLEKLNTESKLNAKWSIAVQWGRRHEFGQANNLILPFFDSVIRNDLQPVRGDVSSWTLDQNGLAWFPNPQVAATWQAFVEKDRQVKIKQPLGLGDKQEFVIHPAGTPIKMDLATRIEGTVEIYAGDRLLESGPGLVIPGLDPGLHPIIAVIKDSKGRVHRSRPHTIIVR